MNDLLRFAHLIGAAIWVGGMLTMAALVPSMRRSGADLDLIRATARRFGIVAWTGIGLAVVTGLAQLIRLDFPTRGNTPLAVKLALVGVAVVVAWAHQMFSRGMSPSVRGAIQGVLILLGLAIVWVAVQI
jgi:putative copper export protein